jgi:hypothetical protein
MGVEKSIEGEVIAFMAPSLNFEVAKATVARATSRNCCTERKRLGASARHCRLRIQTFAV